VKEFRSVYEGYLVSKCGTVMGRRGNPLTPTDNGKGYQAVKMKVGDKWTSRAVHRLVAEAWLPNPLNLPEVNHIDCNRWNPHVSNLEWCTHGYNIEYSYRMRNRSATGESNARCNTTEDIVRQICSKLQAGVGSAEVRDLGYDYNLVRAIKSGKNWSHVSKDYNW
jgi:hypothetical protein